ncbi:MAG TPA: hypothetical protein PLV22_08415 [Candidatus Cloacimonadota bacterium]|nr:hypothetical protein [Candidatus Cloacimonadota bacterium]
MNKARLIILLLLCFIIHHIVALDNGFPIYSGGLASSGLTLLSVSPASSFHNPAVSSQGFAFSYAVPYEFYDMSISSLCYQSHYKSFSYGLGAVFLYDESYQEETFSLNVQYVQQNVIVGVNGKYLRQEATDYRTINAFTADMGMRLKYESVQASWCVRNITESRYKEVEMPVSYNAEIAYYVAANVSVGAGYEKKEESYYNVGAKLEINPFIQLVSSYMIDSGQFACGFQTSINKYRIDYGVKFHPYLEQSHSLTVNYFFK